MKSSRCSWLVLAGWFLLMYVVNAWMPLYRDDYLAAVIWRTGDHLQSMQDVFVSLERYYMMHGGRLVSFFVQFVFMMWGKFWFNIANALVFAAMIGLMYCHMARTRHMTKEPAFLVVLGAFSWLGISHFGEIAIWLCGAAVYLWTGLFTAIFLLPYNLKLAGKLEGRSNWLILPMLLFGWIASCSVENLTVTTSLLVLGACFYCYKKKCLDAWMIAGTVSSLFGSVVCIAAPGNFVRIVEDQDRSMLFHILNQIPSNLEMLMYMLPVILVTVLALRILFLETAKKAGLSLPEDMGKKNPHYVLLGFILLIVVSFFTTGFFANTLRDGIVLAVLTPLGLTDETTIEHFYNTMAGLEEALIYILSVSYVYVVSVQKLGLSKCRIHALKPKVKWRMVWKEYEELRYGVYLMLLSFLNNFVVAGAPSFPGRALFSSSVIFIIGAAAVLHIPVVRERLLESAAGAFFRRGALLVTGFIVVATMVVLHSIWLEDALRISYIAREAERGVQEVHVPPSEIPEQRRILRHIAYDDFDTGMTREHPCYYFGISNIVLDKSMTLDDIR